MKTKKSFTFNKLYLFAFLIPTVIMLVIFAIREIPLATALSCILICTISIFLFWWNSTIN